MAKEVKKSSTKTQNLKEAIDETKQHIKNEITDKTDDLKHKGESLIDEGKRLVDEAEGKIVDWKDNVAEKWINEGSGYIKQNPIKSVLVAFGVGLIWGKMFRK